MTVVVLDYLVAMGSPVLCQLLPNSFFRDILPCRFGLCQQTKTYLPQLCCQGLKWNGSVTSVYLVKFHLLTARGAHKGGGRAKGGQRRASEALSKPLDGRILVLNEHCQMIGCQCKLTTDLSRIREEFQQFRLISCHQ